LANKLNLEKEKSAVKIDRTFYYESEKRT